MKAAIGTAGMLRVLEDQDYAKTHKVVNIFLTQITDPDYSTTVEHCLENKLDINECIERIRAKERRLDRERATR